MCVQFNCTGCSLSFTNHCKDRPADTKAIADSAIAFSNTGSDNSLKPGIESGNTTANKSCDYSTNSDICQGPILTTTITKCETCVRVKGAISKLDSLVFQAPFLVTDGLSGLEKLESWERGNFETLLQGRKKGWDDKAESREERREVQKRIEKMGLDGAIDERKNHQGFDMSVTPPRMEELCEMVW